MTRSWLIFRKDPSQHRVADADRDKLRTVLDNLLSNAVKFTPRGGMVTIRATRGAASFVIDFADTGPGIPESELPYVMDRHYRGTGVSGKGSGLGLAIVQRLCELYGWAIRFENRASGGLRAELNFYVEH